MKRFWYSALLAILFLTACSSGSPPLTATSAPSPTHLPPTSTFTPLPTDTSTPTPTSTPDMTATAAAQATEKAVTVLDELTKLLGDSDIPYAGGHLVWQQSDAISVKMSWPANQIQKINNAPKAGNFILKSDVTWTTNGIILCGVIFRSEDDVVKGKQYEFLYLRLSGLPAWSIEVHEFGQFLNSPTDVKFSDALDLANGATNELLMAVQDETFTLYINGNRQGKYFDYSKQRMEGTFAFLGSQDSGEGNCEFENSWIWSLDE